MSAYRGRFAPSPTGDLHVGSASTALVAWLFARSAGGELALRVEDIDPPRVVAFAERRQLDDLRWLGLDWDEGPDVGGPFAPYRQSERRALHDAAIAELVSRGETYLCDCSRAEIARVASAPHAGDEGPRYPGTCRPHGMRERAWKRPPALRVALPDETIVIDDAIAGRVEQNPWREVGDFVLVRGDGVLAYQLAVVVDDLAMRVTDVVRGRDLLASAPRQALLARMLGGSPPGFAHAPLVVGPNGERLAKRAAGTRIADARDAGVAPETLVGELAASLGLGEGAPASPRELLTAFDASRLVRRPTVAWRAAR